MAMSAFLVAVTRMACLGCAGSSWSSSPKVAPSMVALPWTVRERCSAGGSFIKSGVMRWIASTAVIPGRISFQSMVPVGSIHVGAVRRVCFPSRGNW